MQRRSFIFNILATASIFGTVGLPYTSAFAAEISPSRFKRWRPRLIDESPARMSRLAQEMRAHATIATREHHLHNGAHGVGFWGSNGVADRGACIDPNRDNICGHAVPWGDGTRFFTWHREYLAGLESHLASITVEGRPLRLPSWAPWEPLPEPFRTNGAHHPGMGTADFAAFCDDTIGHFPNDDVLGVILSWGPHFATHARTGGDMALIHKAPLSPIFWPWHAFIDDLYRTYLGRRKRFGDFQPIPKENPFFWQPPASAMPRVSSRGRQQQRRVPFCLGYRRDEAVARLEQAGLRLGATDSNDGAARVISQDPLPWANVSPGSEVKLMMKLPQSGGSGGGFWPPPLPF